jgi:hypothetical protein
MKKDYVCPACHGTIHPGRMDPDSMRQVHEASCPAAMRLTPKRGASS